MELGYGILLEQKQILSQSQIQSLEILSMDGVELSHFLQNEYLENPMLEYKGEFQGGIEELGKVYEHLEEYGKNYEENIEEKYERRKDIAVLDQDIVKNSILEQLQRNRYSEEQWMLLEYMVECLDDNGYFTMPLKEVAEKMNTKEENVANALNDLKALEPCGIFSVDLKECVLKQLSQLDMEGSLTWKIAERYLENLMYGKIREIAKDLKVTIDEVCRSIEQIECLNPRPIPELQSGNPEYVIPDIILKKEDGKWEVELNDGWVENYQINDYYRKMMEETNNEELMEYFRFKLERVRFVLNSIRLRRNRLVAIAEFIIERQRDWIEGKSYLVPMTMKEIAEHIGVNVSTVSRGIRGKYIQYPGGTVLMKELFSSAVVTTEEGFGTEQIKDLIKSFIDGEDKKKPYSDQKIVKYLKEKNIDISRRTVAKYREEMGIRGSFERKKI